MEKNENGYSGRGSVPMPTREARETDGLQLAMVYSPYQAWRMLYTPDEALRHGTLFEELYKPLEERHGR